MCHCGQSSHSRGTANLLHGAKWVEEKPPNREGSCRPRCSFATFPRLHLESSASPCRGRTGATEDPQVARDDAETNPAVHAFDAVVTTARQSMALFEHTDAALAAGPPTQRPMKPARPGLATSTRRRASRRSPRSSRWSRASATASSTRLANGRSSAGPTSPTFDCGGAHERVSVKRVRQRTEGD